MNIGKAARLIRHGETTGLVPPPARSEADYPVPDTLETGGR